jgi:hypothetical protein
MAAMTASHRATTSGDRELLLRFVEPSVDLLSEVVAHNGAERGVVDHAPEEALVGVEAIDDETFKDLVERSLKFSGELTRAWVARASFSTQVY